jgi:hypothetical protein
VRLGGEEPRLGRDSGKERSARPTAWEHGHDMWIAEPGRRCKIPLVR